MGASITFGKPLKPPKPPLRRPWGQTPAPADGPGQRDLVDRRLAQQTAGTTQAPTSARTVTVARDPRLRGLPRSMDIHIPLDPAVFGYNWALAGMERPAGRPPGPRRGHQVGWVERGLDGGDGWVAVYEGYFLGDPATQEAALHATRRRPPTPPCTGPTSKTSDGRPGNAEGESGSFSRSVRRAALTRQPSGAGGADRTCPRPGQAELTGPYAR
ncbi:hypothetical protein [Kitasatospora sp. NPDC050543]|uniref:hypothetical protein n=1 Tax=Kitasatospora sp. NPDC050543 TaxID=3364054 RepID=UPI0037A1809C